MPVVSGTESGSGGVVLVRVVGSSESNPASIACPSALTPVYPQLYYLYSAVTVAVVVTAMVIFNLVRLRGL